MGPARHGVRGGQTQPEVSPDGTACGSFGKRKRKWRKEEIINIGRDTLLSFD